MPACRRAESVSCPVTLTRRPSGISNLIGAFVSRLPPLVGVTVPAHGPRACELGQVRRIVRRPLLSATTRLAMNMFGAATSMVKASTGGFGSRFPARSMAKISSTCSPARRRRSISGVAQTPRIGSPSKRHSNRTASSAPNSTFTSRVPAPIGTGPVLMMPCGGRVSSVTSTGAEAPSLPTESRCVATIT